MLRTPAELNTRYALNGDQKFYEKLSPCLRYEVFMRETFL